MTAFAPSASVSVPALATVCLRTTVCEPSLEIVAVTAAVLSVPSERLTSTVFTPADSFDTSIARVAVAALKATVSMLETFVNWSVRAAAAITRVSVPNPPLITSSLVRDPTVILSAPEPPVTERTSPLVVVIDNLPVKADASTTAPGAVAVPFDAKSSAAVIVRSLSPVTIKDFSLSETTPAKVDFTSAELIFRVSMPAALNVPAERFETVRFCVSAVPETTDAL